MFCAIVEGAGERILARTPLAFATMEDPGEPEIIFYREPKGPDMNIAAGDIDAQVVRVFENLKAVAAAAGGSLDHAVRVTVYLTDLANFARVNEVMAKYFSQPYPARAAVGVASLPRGALVEIDAVLHLA